MPMSRGGSGRTVRIIGGNWRGRKVSFARHDDIRPTPARIRETLFNWLQHRIHGARCLELYAGSGILSMEALSRGASHVTLVESSPQVMAHVEGVLSALCPEPERYACHRMTAASWLQTCKEDPYDIVFLDPPFGSDELGTAMASLDQGALLTPNAVVYIENDQAVSESSLPGGWTLHRQKRAGHVHYCLATPGPVT